MKLPIIKLSLLNGARILILIGLIFRITSDFFLLSDQASNDLTIVSGRVAKLQSGLRNEDRFLLDGINVATKSRGKFINGEIVTVRGRLLCYESFKCLRGRIEQAEILDVKRDIFSEVITQAEIVRERFTFVYKANLKTEQANLMSGIVLGNTDLNQSFKEKLRIVGLSHVVAASGMNVTLVAGLIFSLGKTLRVHQRRIVFLAGAMVGGYCLVSGLQPPIIRASMMLAGVLMGSLTGRKSSGFYSLLLTCMIMLWVSPKLLFDFGFLLSFASMTGQIVLITLRINLPKYINFMGEIFLQNLLAIAFSLPIVLVGFSSFSLISIISNLLVVWTIEPLMILGLAAGIVGLVSGQLAGFVLSAAGILLNYFLFVVKALSNENYLFKFENFNLVMAAGYYLLLFSVISQFRTWRLKAGESVVN